MSIPGTNHIQQILSKQTEKSNSLSKDEAEKVFPVQNLNDVNSVPQASGDAKRNRDVIDNEIKLVISQLKEINPDFNISIDEIYNILKYCNYTDEKLLSMTTSEYKQFFMCVYHACKHVSTSCSKKDYLKELPKVLIMYKVYMVDMHYDSKKAFDEIQKHKEMDLFDIMQEIVDNTKNADKNSPLNKLLNGKQVKDLSPRQLKELFKSIIFSKTDKNKHKNPELFLDFFTAALSKCEPEEKKKIFHAFALLLQDKDMGNSIKVAYGKWMQSAENMDELHRIISEYGPEILKIMGFTDEQIQLLNLSSLKDIEPSKLGELLDLALKTLAEINEADLLILGSILNGQKNIKELSPDEKQRISKYVADINSIIDVMAVSASEPDKYAGLKTKFQILYQMLQEKNLSEYVSLSLQEIFSQNLDFFNNMSKDDFTKIMNEYSNNTYGNNIGDENPENLYIEQDNKNIDVAVGMVQKSTLEDINALYLIIEQKQINFCQEDSENSIYVEKSDSQNSPENVTNPVQNFSNIKKLSAKDIHEGLNKKYIKLSDVLSEYNNLSQEGRDFVEGIIKTKSKFLQSYYLDCIKNNNSAKVEIAISIGLNADKLQLALDYANMKKLERQKQKNEMASN